MTTFATKKNFKRLIILFITALSVLFVTLLTWNLLTPSPPIAQDSGKPSSFKGKIVAVSDADNLATSYADGKLNKVAGIEDTLTVVEVNKQGKPVVLASQHVSSSVLSWPAQIATSKNKKVAYVAETRAAYTGTTQTINDVWKDLPKGSKITVLDISKPNTASIIQEKAVGVNIEGASINYDNTLLAAGSGDKGKEIIIATLDSNGLIIQPFYFTDNEVKTPDARDFDWTVGVKTIEFHPTKNIIAANFDDKRVVFFEITVKDKKVHLTKIGNSLEVGKCWGTGNWTPNGKYFIISDVNWGKGDAGAMFNGNGSLVSVAFNKSGQHKIVSSVKVGLSPEGFDISPDGKYAVVANMRRTYAPKDFWFLPARKNASLSLVNINQKTGKLTNDGKEYGFEGALPEDAIFDEESNSVAVAVFQKQDEDNPTQGWIEFWELENDTLIRTGKKLMVTRGVNNLKLVP